MIAAQGRISDRESMHPGMKRTLRELRLYIWATTALVSVTAISLMYISFAHGV